MSSIIKLIRLVELFGGVRLLLRIVLRLRKGLKRVRKMFRRCQVLVEQCNWTKGKKAHHERKLNLLDLPYK